MSKIFDRGIIPPPETYDQAVDLCGYVRDLKAADVVQIEQTQWGDQLLVILAGDSPTRPYYAFVSDRNDLLDLARRILGTLNPVTHEELLEKVRRLVGNQG